MIHGTKLALTTNVCQLQNKE